MDRFIDSCLSGQSLQPAVMGIINCTADSFYPGSRVDSVEKALETARRMIRDGADILDIGGESSRPGSEYVDAGTELDRVLPVVHGIRKFSDIPISIDTRKAPVARACLDAGAGIVNDISALRDDPELIRLVRERRVPVILMHMRETPRTMQDRPEYRDTVAEILEELAIFARNAEDAGIDRRTIVIDPGIGFGKTVQDNLLILQNLTRFTELGYPVVLGASRKSFIGRVLGDPGGKTPGIADPAARVRPVEGRLAGTLAVHLWAALQGVEILRVHDVAETVDVLKVLSAVRNADQELSM